MAKIVKYAKYNDIPTAETVLTFNEVGVEVEVKKIAKGFVVLMAENLEAINNIIDAQDSRISTTLITKELFLEAVKDSETVKAIENNVSCRIRKKYSIDDELSMQYKDDAHADKIAYLQYRQEQVDICKEQKAELGL